jgi:error-prone DNA polymerase
VRLGFRQVKGLRQDDIAILLAARAEGFIHVNQLRKAGVPEAALEKLADADAFRSLNLDRRKALWELFAKDKPGALFEDLPPESVHEHIQLPVMTDSEHVVHDYATTALSLKAHPVSFVRERLSQHNILATKALSTLQNGVFVQVAGLVLVRQRPGTAKGVCFMTIEDETGVANLVIFQNLFDLYRKEILQSRLIMVKGKLQREGDVIHIIVSSCFNMSKLLRQLTPASNEQLPLLTLSRADEKSVPANPDSRMRASENAGEKVIHGGRNFK